MREVRGTVEEDRAKRSISKKERKGESKQGGKWKRRERERGGKE